MRPEARTRRLADDFAGRLTQGGRSIKLSQQEQGMAHVGKTQSMGLIQNTKENEHLEGNL